MGTPIGKLKMLEIQGIRNVDKSNVKNLQSGTLFPSIFYYFIQILEALTSLYIYIIITLISMTQKYQENKKRF